MLWLHLRNSPIRWTLPVLISLDLALLFVRNRYWIGVWPQTGAAGQVPAYLLGIVAAGEGGGAAPPLPRHGIDEQLSPAQVPLAVREAYRLGATAIILVIPYLVGQATGFALTARTFPPGVLLWSGYAALGLFVLLTCVGLGWLTGRVLGSTFAALVATLGTLLLIGLFERWSGFMVISGPSERTVDPLSLGLRVGAVLALLTALCWIPPRSARMPRHIVAPVGAAILIAVALLGTPTVELRAPAGDRVTCVNGSSMLCVWPEQEKYLPSLREVSARIDALPDAFTTPPRVNAVGIEQLWATDPHGDVYLAGPQSFHIFEGSPWSYAGEIATAIMVATFTFADTDHCTWDHRTDSDQARMDALEAWLETYLVGGGTPDYHTNAPSEILRAWAAGRAIAAERPLAAQFTWAEAEVRDLHGQYCGA